MKIPRLGKKSRQNTTVQRQTIDPRVASQGSRDLANLASQGTQVIGQIKQKRKVAAQNDYLRETRLEYEQDVYDKEVELKKTYRGDHQGYSEAMGEFLDERESYYLDKAPDSESQKEFKFKLREFNQDNLMRADKYENTKRAENFLNNQAKVTQQTSIRYYETPDANRALKELPMTLSDLDKEIGVTASEARISKIKDDYKTNTRKSLLKGMIDQGRFDQAEMVLESDQYASLRDNATPDEIAGFKSNIKRKREIASKERIRAVKENFDNAVQFNITGESDPIMEEQVLAVQREIESLPESEDKSELLDTFNKSRIVGRAIGSLKDMPYKDMMKTSPEDLIQGDLDTYSKDEKMRGILADAIKQDIQARETDSSGYIESNNPMMRGPDKVKSRIERAKEMGVKNPRAISKTESKRQIALLQESPTSKDLAYRLDKVIETYGDANAKYALADMVEDGLDPSLAMAANFNDNRAKTIVLDNIKNEKELSDSKFKEFRAKSELDEAKTAIKDQTQELENAVRNTYEGLGQTSQAYINSIRKTVSLETKRIMMKDENMSPSDAAEQAFNSTLSNLGNPVSYESDSDRQHSALVPQGIDNRKVEAFFKHYSNSDMLETMQVSGKYQVADMEGPEFREYVAENGYWSTNKQQDGVNFIFVDPKGNREILRNDVGDPVSVRFTDMGNFKSFPKVNKEISNVFGYNPQKESMKSLSGKYN